MANNYFKFKKFTIRQQDCPMKVCTDSCVLGAYAASEIMKRNSTAKNILDIGGGTGLLSLMIAQKNNLRIDAVEMQSKCYMQMNENFNCSLWHKNLNAVHSDIMQWNPRKKFDFIISNPPFYERDLKGSDKGRTVAMHDSGLLLNELIHCIRLFITANGNFCIMIPASRQNYFEEELRTNGASITSVLALKHRKDKKVFRFIYSGNFLKPGHEFTTRELIIEDEGGYTNDFKNLLKDYYLNL